MVWDFEIVFARPKGQDIPVNIPLEHFATYESFVKHLEEVTERRRQEEVLRQTMISLGQQEILNQAQNIPTSPAEEAKMIYTQARNYYLNSNFTETITLLETYIRRFPNGEDIAMAYYILGELFYVHGNYERAIPNFNNVYRIRRDKVVESLFFLAKSNEKLSEYGNAIRHYNILIREFPNSPLSRTANEQIQLLRESQ
jgi:TolA-binding protein